jgi:isoprenylcysteine carboxyl methyltransferase (ICMT) family protein YpbQ
MSSPAFPSPSALGPQAGTLDLWSFARRMLWACLIVEAVLVVGDVVFNLKEYWTNDVFEDLWNMGGEDSLTTWFSGLQLFFVALVAWFCARLSDHRALGGGRKAGWIVAAVFFCYLSADEVAQIHEGIGSAIARDRHEARVEERTQEFLASGLEAEAAEEAAEEAVQAEYRQIRIDKLVASGMGAESAAERVDKAAKKADGDEKGLDTYGWQIYVLPCYLLAALLITLLLGPALWREGLFGWYVVGGLVYLAAHGLDRLEGMWWFDLDAEALADRWDVRKYDVKHPVVMLEELCEMLGVTLLCQAFLRHMASLGDGLALRFTSRRA